MAKDRSYGDRGTGFTARTEKKFGRGSRWCRICGCYTSCIKNMIYIYVDSVLEKLQTLWDSKNYGDMLASN